MSIASLAGRTAVVTGAASGIGWAIVEELLAQGASVFLADVDDAALCDGLRRLAAVVKPGQCVDGRTTDVSKEESVIALADAAAATLGEIDLLFANAGVTTPYGGAPDETPLADWHWQFDVNVFGIVHCLRVFLPRMRAKRSASHIVLTASSSGLLPTGNRAAYCASKHAVIGLGESLYLQLKGTQVGVSLLVPGVTDTPMLRPDRHRPDGKPGRPLNPALVAQAKAPRVVARMAVEAVKSGAFWIVTHEDIKPAVLARAQAIAGGSLPPDSYH
jgi:NAD(P)-dependent dehydrogenase (short-subunit alcohol dehydrogenase family)